MTFHRDGEHLGDDALGQARAAPLIRMSQDIAPPAGHRHADPALKGDKPDCAGTGVQGAEHVAVRPSPVAFLAYGKVRPKEQDVDNPRLSDCLDLREVNPVPSRIGRVDRHRFRVLRLVADPPDQDVSQHEPHEEQQKEKCREQHGRGADFISAEPGPKFFEFHVLSSMSSYRSRF